MSTGKTAVLLLAHGTPDKPEDVPAYMRHITGGRPVADSIMAEVQHRYALIGRSPLTDITMQQAEALEKELAMPVYVGMRNWRPFIGETVKRMVADGITRAVAICMAPQNSRTSVGLYKRAALAEAGADLRLAFVEEWHDHPLLARAFANRFKPAWQAACAGMGARVPVIFTAHSVPCRTIVSDETGNGDPYSNQAKETARMVAALVPELSEKDWHFAFQSQGMSGGMPWIGPTVEATILALKAEGHRGVFLQPIGFVCDHVEVLYDIDIFFRKFAGDLGMKLWRAESLNTSPEMIAALADLARGAMKAMEGAV